MDRSNQQPHEGERQDGDAGSLRVQLDLLDSLMNLAGELVLSRNQLLQIIATRDFGGAEAVGQRIDLITSELQEAIMLTRMQPIGTVCSHFPQLVDELAGKLGKEVQLALTGQEVELDKTIIEAIAEPLRHIVHNAVEHGIEEAGLRQAAGKAGQGQVGISARHEAGQVRIEVRDDGRGIDGDRLAAAAVKSGLLAADQAQALTSKEKVDLIFFSGLSLAGSDAAVSGRGQGMAQIRGNLDKLGGSVEVLSEIGAGTTVALTLPLTLAIIPCQIIETGDERYAIPQVNLDELLRIPADRVKDRIELVGDAEVVRLRGTLLPLLRLADLLGLERTYIDGADGVKKPDRRQRIADRRSKSHALPGEKGRVRDERGENDFGPRRSVIDRRSAITNALNIVVVSTGEIKYGLIVDKLLDSEEIVIKPLGRHFHACHGYAGATIMGDGKVALILDVSNLGKMAGLATSSSTSQAVAAILAAEQAEGGRESRQSLLIFRSAENEQFAVPLAQVERIEKIKRGQIEELGGKRVMQYRGGSLSLLCIDDVAGVLPLAGHDDLLVIVFHIGVRLVGLLATGPIDALETSLTLDSSTLTQPGISGSAIINDTTTLMVDMAGIVGALFPE
jgi:two-component system, chemotaxis family, sensor kinase CheA